MENHTMKEQNQQKNKDSIYFIIMEYAWLTISLASLYTAINNYIYHGFDNESIKFSVLFAEENIPGISNGTDTSKKALVLDAPSTAACSSSLSPTALVTSAIIRKQYGKAATM